MTLPKAGMTIEGQWPQARDEGSVSLGVCNVHERIYGLKTGDGDRDGLTDMMANIPS